MTHRIRIWTAVLFMGSLLPWVAQGSDDSPPSTAKARDHWSFRAIERPAVPAVQDAAWVRNSIDRFVLARLESLGIAPAQEADRATLIRRLSIDLLGLPPSPQEVDAFIADTSPMAYDRLVSRLLASPHFGERWGRHWLDLARYADSDGYEKDSPRPYAYLYRNWVIDAINRDLPFDQFTIEQLAGDLLPQATLEQRMATGFHRNTLTNREGGVDQEEFRAKANVDRVSTTATVWLGLTLACAECHNHKYDPISQKDFYSLYSFFDSSMESETPAPQPAEQAAFEAARAAYDAERAKLAAALEQFEKEQLPARFAEWDSTNSGKPIAARWSILDPLAARSSGGASMTQQTDGSIQLAGKTPASDMYTVEIETRLAGITAIRLEVLPDPSHPAGGPGRVPHGNFVLNEFSVKVLEPDGSSRPVALQKAVADFSQDRFGVAGAIDGNPATGWAIAPQFGKRHAAVFETKEDIQSPSPSNTPIRLQITLDQQYGAEHTIGRFRLSAATQPRPVPGDDVPESVIAAMQAPGDQRTEQQRHELLQYYRSIDSEWHRLNQALVDYSKKAPPPPATRAMTIAQNPKPPQTHIHMRGDFLRKGDAVDAGVPAVLQPAVPLRPHGDQPTRLDLARWLTDPANPLTARVTVNRIWQHLFGKGLVGTPDDFGARGEMPTHPALLDWLASEFMEPTEGVLPRAAWQQKEMIRLIVSSATYRQSSAIRPELVEQDPTNTLLARQNRFRLEAEIVRDMHLAASGLLEPRVGGPSVRPPQPAGISDLTYAGSAKWVESTGSDRYRRGMYTWFQRTSPYPMLTMFDSPDGVVCTVKRERSNTPLQALTLLNDNSFLECARSLAGRAIAAANSPEPQARVRQMFRYCMGRQPSDAELARLVHLNRDLTEACRADADLARQLAAGAAIDGVEPVDTAAWIATARAIMNLDEFVTRE